MTLQWYFIYFIAELVYFISHVRLALETLQHAAKAFIAEFILFCFILFYLLQRIRTMLQYMLNFLLQHLLQHLFYFITARPQCSLARQFPSVRPSVRHSVTFRYCVLTNEDAIMQLAASDRTIPLVSGEIKFIRIFAGDHPEQGR